MSTPDPESDIMDMSDDDGINKQEDGNQKDEESHQENGRQHKRKLSEADSRSVVRKKSRLEHVHQEDVASTLPGAVWQRIMLLLSPAMLLRLTRVSKHFQFLLTHAKSAPVSRDTRLPAALIIDSEAIWATARRNTYPSLPRPLSGWSEAGMIRLITQLSCSMCSKRGQPIRSRTSVDGGPGAHGVRPIWQFHCAVCGPCLKKLSISEIDFLKERLSLAPGILRRGLAYVFMTREMNVVNEATVRANTGVGMVKLFSLLDIDKVYNEYRDAQLLGEGAAEEWKKGLDDMGKSAMSDAHRWSRWEESLPPGTYLPDYMRLPDAATFAPEQYKAGKQQTQDSSVENKAITQNTPHPLPQPVHAGYFALPAQSLVAIEQTQRRARDPREVQEAQRLRREDIHRRCQQLLPPLTPEVLQHISAYTASLQIGRPMTDAEWTNLLPRLEAERHTAEVAHYEKAQQMAMLRAAVPQPLAQNQHQTWQQNRDIDRSWEVAREALRKKLAEYADDIINGKWLRASAVDQDSAPLFAAEVLLHVYDKYEEEVLAMYGPDNDVEELSLDDLKWVFDHKVRGIAESKCRDMFACAGCYEENEVRWFAFEGLIQHYGAKHTDDFTKGNVTVHWQTAKWPKEQPFVTNLTRIIKPKPVYRENRARHIGRPDSGQRQPMLSEQPLFSQAPVPTPQQAGPSEDVLIAHVTADAADTWNALEGPKLPGSIRVWTTLQQAKTKYEKTFHTYLPMDVFTKALTLQPALSALKDCGELTCRFCEPNVHTQPAYQAVLENKKRHKLSNLLNHFKITHVNNGAVDPTTWMDFLDLPAKNDLTDLLNMPGMDDNKLALVAHAFPGVYPNPLPTIGTVTQRQPENKLAARLIKRSLDRPSGQQKLTKKQKKALARAQAQGTGYDPADPTIPGMHKEEELDPSLFDSDMRKSPPKPVQLAIEPATLAAIDKIGASVSSIQRAHLEAPPSPLANTRLALPKPVAVPAGPPPDITDIIRQLQGQPPLTKTPAAPSAPTPSLDSTPVSGQSWEAFLRSNGYNPGPPAASHVPPAAPTPAAPPAWTYQHDQYHPAQPQRIEHYRRPSPQPAYHTPPVKAGDDLLAALSQNRHTHEQARAYYSQAEAGPPATTQPTYAYPYAQAYHPAAAAPPPQYAQPPLQYAPPPQQTSFGQQHAPVQYVQAYAAPPVQYQYEDERQHGYAVAQHAPPSAHAYHPVPPPQPVYYDAYGRPIEYAPRI